MQDGDQDDDMTSEKRQRTSNSSFVDSSSKSSTSRISKFASPRFPMFENKDDSGSGNGGGQEISPYGAALDGFGVATAGLAISSSAIGVVGNK